MLFKEITGQQSVWDKLLQTVKSGRIGHAQLFSGAPGSGQLPLAIAFATYILCRDRQSADACGVCPSCRMLSKLAHPDLHFVMPVNTTKKVKKDPRSDLFADAWREAVLHNPYLKLEDWLALLDIENKQGIINVHQSAEMAAKLNLTSFEGGYKVVIIWLPEKMNPAAANKLLKLLEEPEDYTLFLMASEDAESILPTVSSRLQLFQLERLNHQTVADALVEKFGVGRQGAMEIAEITDGDFSEAVRLVSDVSDPLKYSDLFVQWMRMCFQIKKEMPALVQWIDQLSASGRETQISFLRYALLLIRKSIRLNCNLPVGVHPSEERFLRKFSPYVNQSNRNEMNNLFNEAITHIQRNAYAKILFMDVSIKVSRLLKAGQAYLHMQEQG